MGRRVLAVVLAIAGFAAPASAQAPLRKIGELDLRILGVSAACEPASPVVPKNTASAVRIVVRSGGTELSSADVAELFGAGFAVGAELSGPGLAATLTLPHLEPGDALPADPMLLPIPALPAAGDYTLANLRIVSGGRPVLDVAPSSVVVKVIDQILVTSVKTRPLTLDELRDRGVDLSSPDNYLGFAFTLGLKLESNVVSFTMPVVFDRQGRIVPEPINATRRAAALVRRAGVHADLRADAARRRGGRRHGRPGAVTPAATRWRTGPHPERARDPRQRRLPQAVLLGTAVRRERRAGGLGTRGARRDGTDPAPARTGRHPRQRPDERRERRPAVAAEPRARWREREPARAAARPRRRARRCRRHGRRHGRLPPCRAGHGRVHDPR